MKNALRAASLAAWALVACDPEIPTEANPPRIVALFDTQGSPAVMPYPNDLLVDPVTGSIAVSDPVGLPGAQRAFNRYLRTLDGFPPELGASVEFSGVLSSSSVHAGAVRVLDVTNPLAVTEVTEGIRVELSSNRQTISIAPPGGRWGKSRQYAIAVLGGDVDGVRSVSGQEVVGSPEFFLVRGRRPLVTGCSDLTSFRCRSATALISGDNAGSRAATLERARRLLAPALEHLETGGLPRERLVAAWTFSTMKQPIVSFDPASGVMPFPNQLLTVNGRINLPILATDDAATRALKQAINGLTGFSTTAHLVTEGSDGAGAADERLDAATLASSQFVVTTFHPAGREDTPVDVACRSCGSGSAPPGAEPDEIALRPRVPLRSDRAYSAVWKRGVEAFGRGRKANVGLRFALMRVETPLVDEKGQSLIAGVRDAIANEVEPLRASMQGTLQAADALSLRREDVLLAWTFVTRNTSAALREVVERPQAWRLPGAVEGDMLGLVPLDTTALADLADATRQPFRIRRLWEGRITIGSALEALDGAEGRFAPALLAQPRLEAVPFLLALPASPASADGAIPVVVFQHGFGRSRRDAALIANAMAQRGFATLAIDAPMHGARSVCARDAECAPGTGCVQNRCPGGYAVDPLDPLQTPLISGRGFLSIEDPLATRDHLLQASIDVSQLARALRDGTVLPYTGLGGIDVDDPDTEVAERLDVDELRYVGHSLGGISGVAASAAIRWIERATLSAPGGGLADLLLLFPGLEDERRAFDGALAGRGILPGSQRYERHVDLLRWALDPVDPLNHGLALIAEPSFDAAGGFGPRKVFVSWMEGDDVVPNATTERLVRSIVVPPSRSSAFKQKRYSGGGHRFLLDATTEASRALMVEAQTDAADWLTTAP